MIHVRTDYWIACCGLVVSIADFRIPPMHGLIFASASWVAFEDSTFVAARVGIILGVLPSVTFRSRNRILKLYRV